MAENGIELPRYLGRKAVFKYKAVEYLVLGDRQVKRRGCPAPRADCCVNWWVTQAFIVASKRVSCTQWLYLFI